MSGPRSAPQRKADTIAKLEAVHADAWFASAATGRPAHLVPLSYAWDGTQLVFAVESRASTTRNVRESGAARIALGHTRDVVMIDATLTDVVDVHSDADLANTYVRQADWDPRVGSGHVFLTLRPVRVQAWREVDEIQGRTLMRDGNWVV